MKGPGPQPLWKLVSALERNELQAWRQTYHAGDDLETACAEHLAKIETTCSRYRGGLISVSIVVLDRKESNSTQGYFRLQRALNGLVQVEKGTSTQAS